MANLAEVRSSIKPFLDRVRTWNWQLGPGAPPEAGMVLPREKWIESLSVERWEPLRHRWRNLMVDPLNASEIPVPDWNALIRDVRGELKSLLDGMLGPGILTEVSDSVRWDVLMAWKATALAIPSPYLTILRLYAAGWLVGGPVSGDTVDNLAVIAANRVVFSQS